jgi:Mor family transcriptional regulator
MELQLERKVISEYMNGANAVQVAKLYNIGETSVYRILHKHHIYPSKLFNKKKRWKGILSPEQDKEIASLYSKGILPKELAQKYNCCVATIRNAVRRAGVKINPKGGRYREFTKEEIREIRQRWQNGESQTKIAQAFKTHQTIISKIMAQNDMSYQRKARLDKHGSWKGGRVDQGGYDYIKIAPDHLFAEMAQRGGYVAEHRLRMAEKLGRCLHSYETVHHINGDKKDNRIENLQLRIGKHGKGESYRCADCGSTNIIREEI